MTACALGIAALAAISGYVPTTREMLAADLLRQYSTGVVNRAELSFAIREDPQLAEDEWRVKGEGNTLRLSGGGTRGVFYAVSHFLEDVCGVRFWNDTETDVPEGVRVSPSAVDLRGRPAFSYRDIYRSSDPSDATPAFAILRRLNRNGEAGVTEAYGGDFSFGPPYYVHTFDLYIPWEKYKDSHPEYFSLVDGKRQGGRLSGQLCLACPAVKPLLLEGVKKSIAAGEASAKARGVPASRLYDLSQNDCTRLCECPECLKAKEEIGYSGQYLNLINAIAEEVAKEHPEVFITTLAYEMTEPPPKKGIVPRDNVIVCLCDTRSSQVLPLTHPANRETADIVSAWGKIAPHLKIWDYAGVYKNPSVVFTIPTEFTIAEDYRFFLTNNVFGVFAEHEGRDRDFFDIKYYLMSRLMEDPNQDADALVRDAMDRSFGAAGKTIYGIRHRLHELALAATPTVTFMAPTHAFDFLTREELEAMSVRWDEAEALVAGDERSLRRVKFARKSQDTMLRFRRGCPRVVGQRFVYSPETLMELEPPKGYALVDDPALKGRKALAVDRRAFNPVAFAAPLKCALWSPTQGKYTFEGAVDYSLGDAYVWYDLGTVNIPENTQNVFYFGKAWNLHNYLAMPGLNGRKANLKVSIRASETEIRIGGYVFTVEPEEGK